MLEYCILSVMTFKVLKSWEEFRINGKIYVRALQTLQ